MGERSALKRRDRASRLLHTYVFVFSLVLLAVSVQTYVIKQNTEDIDRQQAGLRAAVIGACERANRLRENDNRNAATLYEMAVLASHLSARGGKRFHMLSGELGYVPTQNCEEAFGTPSLYRAPKRLPLSQLTPSELASMRRAGRLE